MLPLNRYHRRLCKALSALGLSYIAEYTVGKRSCDIYIPELGLVVEVDGPWHMGKRDRVRDAEIEAERPDLSVLHIKTGTPLVQAIDAILSWGNNP